jgi:hypothetical protein
MNFGNLKNLVRTVFVCLILAVFFGAGEVLAHDGAEGSSNSTARTLTTTQDYIVGSAIVTLGTSHSHVCNVIASTRLLQQSAGSGTWSFYVRALSQAVPAGSIRYVQLDGQEQIHSVSTNFTFKNLTGTRTFVFYAKKTASGVPNIAIDSNSMSVSCFDQVF